MYKSVDNYDCMSPVCCSPTVEVTSDQGECGEYRSCEASAPWAGVTPPSIPSCIMTKLSLVRGTLNPKCKDLMLCLRDRTSLLSAGGRGAMRAQWGGKGRGLCPARSLLTFPHETLWEACSQHHRPDLLCNDKESTSRWGCSWVWAVFNSLPGSHNLLKVGLWSRGLPVRAWHGRIGDS